MSIQTYKILPELPLSIDDFSLVPIRLEDRHEIRRWRNDQISILRQSKPLSEKDQDIYFSEVVQKLFDQQYPAQILFSFLYKGELIGYGGLVHIDWVNLNAEISFLSATERANDSELFVSDWIDYLKMISIVADRYLNFIKIYTYAYDVRPNLYIALERSGFTEEARLRKHALVANKMTDVLIHSKFLMLLKYRRANPDDALLYFNWANEEAVRNNSFNSAVIKWEDHIKWFNARLESNNTDLLIFFDLDDKPVGQVRIENNADETVIGISVDTAFRGKSLSSKMLLMATKDFFARHPDQVIAAYIKTENISSYKAFCQAGFTYDAELIVSGYNSYKLTKRFKL